MQVMIPNVESGLASHLECVHDFKLELLSAPDMSFKLMQIKMRLRLFSFLDVCQLPLIGCPGDLETDVTVNGIAG